MRRFVILAVTLVGLSPSPAASEADMSGEGFTVSNSATVAASPAEVWEALIDPSRYWSPDHSYSGDAANLSLEPRAGGCFCETLPEDGSVEHLRVLRVQPGNILRLSGALGPLQSEGLAGALTWRLEPTGDGTTIHQTYVVGGRFDAFERDTIAPAVDGVLREQLERLAALFGPQR